MKIPYDGKVNPRLVYEKYKNTVFYYVRKPKGYLSSVVPCVLRYSDAYPTYIYLSEFEEDWKLKKSLCHFEWENLFLSMDEAKKVSKKYNSLLKAFKRIPYVTYECLNEHFKELKETENLIDKLLSKFENYEGIDFCDVSANGIQIRLHHKKIKGYVFGKQITIKYDFSNVKEVPYLVAQVFIDNDNEETINEQLRFIEFGEKYGWD